ncbi:unnamed protein product [Gordionus sp. m RMFG-2023]
MKKNFPILFILSLHLFVHNDNNSIFVNLSTYKNKPSLLIMVCPKSLKESLKNGKISKLNCSIIVFVIASNHIPTKTEAGRNRTYIIMYKTARMNKPIVKYIIQQENRKKKY